MPFMHCNLINNTNIILIYFRRIAHKNAFIRLIHTFFLSRNNSHLTRQNAPANSAPIGLQLHSKCCQPPNKIYHANRSVIHAQSTSTCTFIDSSSIHSNRMYKYLHLCVAIRNEIRNVALFPALVLDNVEKASKRIWLMWKTNDNAGRGGGGGIKHPPQVIGHKSQIDKKVGIQIVWGWWEGNKRE